MDVNFTKNAQGLSRNPLGIIALFLSLIYVLACLVLGTTATKLETIERLPLIWFVVIFPVFILLSFMVLVVYHHTKLYAPVDFRDDTGFLASAKVTAFSLQTPSDAITKESSEAAMVADENSTKPSELVDYKRLVTDFLLKSSPVGLYSLKIAALSAQHAKAIPAEDIVKIDPMLSVHYCYGYLVSAAGFGLFSFTSQGEILSFTNVYSDLDGMVDRALDMYVEKQADSAKEIYQKVSENIKRHFEN